MVTASTPRSLWANPMYFIVSFMVSMSYHSWPSQVEFITRLTRIPWLRITPTSWPNSTTPNPGVMRPEEEKNWGPERNTSRISQPACSFSSNSAGSSWGSPL